MSYFGWGASWIYKASGINSYMEFIQSNGHILGADDDGYTFSWDDKRPGTKVLLSKVCTPLLCLNFMYH
jgi:hypothetical protein